MKRHKSSQNMINYGSDSQIEGVHIPKDDISYVSFEATMNEIPWVYPTKKLDIDIRSEFNFDNLLNYCEGIQNSSVVINLTYTSGSQNDDFMTIMDLFGAKGLNILWINFRHNSYQHDYIKLETTDFIDKIGNKFTQYKTLKNVGFSDVESIYVDGLIDIIKLSNLDVRFVFSLDDKSKNKSVTILQNAFTNSKYKVSF